MMEHGEEQKRTGIAGRSDIPLALRNQIARREEIVAERDDAARTCLMLSCIALNELYGFGFERLTKYAQKLNELISEHYESPELLDYHREDLVRRLEQMGFTFHDGRMYSAYDAQTGEYINKHKLGDQELEYDPPGAGKRLRHD